MNSTTKSLASKIICESSYCLQWEICLDTVPLAFFLNLVGQKGFGDVIDEISLIYPEILANISAYWIEATKNAIDSKYPTSCEHFETMHNFDQYALINTEIMRAINANDDYRCHLMDERCHVETIKRILAVLVLATNVDSVTKVLQIVLKSQYSVEYMDVIAQNCSSQEFGCFLFEAMGISGRSDKSYPMSSSQGEDAHAMWRYFRIILSIAAKSRQLALTLRSELITRQQFPNLCFEITMRYTHDIVDMLSCLISNIGNIGNCWLFLGLNQAIVEAIAAAVIKEVTSTKVDVCKMIVRDIE